MLHIKINAVTLDVATVNVSFGSVPHPLSARKWLRYEVFQMLFERLAQVLELKGATSDRACRQKLQRKRRLKSIIPRRCCLHVITDGPSAYCAVRVWVTAAEKTRMQLQKVRARLGAM
eukprot:1837586-Pleurochrysis_carterae.AAC.1